MDLPVFVGCFARKMASWGYLNTDEAFDILEATDVAAQTVKGRHEDPVRRAIATFKDRWGTKYKLSGGDDLDPDTQELINRRFCNCSDFLSIDQTLRRWNSPRITWAGAATINGLSWTEAQRFTQEQVAAACKVRLITGVGGRVNLQTRPARIDGQGGTLARAWLPQTPSNVAEHTLVQEYDTAETFDQHAFNLTVAHETGHNLGLLHDEGDEIALMDPFLNTQLTGYQPADQRQYVLRYGDNETDEGDTNPTPQCNCPAGFGEPGQTCSRADIFRLIRSVVDAIGRLPE